VRRVRLVRRPRPADGFIPFRLEPSTSKNPERVHEKSRNYVVKGFRYLLRHEAVRKMKAGPSESPYRGRLQTAMSGSGQKPWS